MKLNNGKIINLNRLVQLLFVLVVALLVINCSGDSDSGGNTNTSSPQIVVTGSVSDFSPTPELEQSAFQSMQVKGEDLTSDLTISATSNFKVSLDGENTSDEVTISKDVANAGETLVYTLFSPSEGSVGTINGVLTFQSSQAPTITKNLRGVGVSITPVINTSTNSLDFGEVTMMNTSEPMEVTINGDNLVTDLALNASEGFQISLDNVTYSSTLQIPASSTNDDTIVYVNFSPILQTVYSGTLLIENDEADDVTVYLQGEGLPVIHNYLAFNEQSLGFGGGFSQSSSQVFNLHSDLSNIAQIKMYLQIDCPATGCDDWDRFANVKVKDAATGEWFEIGRYITPYWTGTQQLERGLEFDVTDFKSLLTGSVELRIYIENWTAKADIITLEFDYIEGTPDYPYYAVSEVLGYHVNSIDGVPYGVPHSFDLDKQITIPGNTESTHLKTIISGWGHASPNDTDGRPCAEWCYRTHNIKINGSNMFSHDLGPLGCAANPVSNQNPGNWTQDRAGWCPGMVVPSRIDEFATSMAGSSLSFEYDFEDWTNDNNNGSAYYATSTYVVVKSNTLIDAPIVTD